MTCLVIGKYHVWLVRRDAIASQSVQLQHEDIKGHQTKFLGIGFVCSRCEYNTCLSYQHIIVWKEQCQIGIGEIGTKLCFKSNISLNFKVLILFMLGYLPSLQAW